MREEGQDPLRQSWICPICGYRNPIETGTCTSCDYVLEDTELEGELLDQEDWLVTLLEEKDEDEEQR